MFLYRFSKWLRSSTPYLMLVGFAFFFGAWFLLLAMFSIALWMLGQARPVESPWAVVAGLAIVAAVIGLVLGVTDRGLARGALLVWGALALVLAAIAWALRTG